MTELNPPGPLRIVLIEFRISKGFKTHQTIKHDKLVIDEDAYRAF